jgi:NADH:ubiquinone oxidoreductase subunit E
VTLTALEPRAREIIARYDEPRAAVLPLLWLVHETFGHVSSEAEYWVGGLVGLAVSHVREVVSFYTMFRTTAGGRRELRVCTSLPCLLRGADQVLTEIEDRLHIKPGETTPGGELTLTEVECLCACELAPMAQLDEQFIGPLTQEGSSSLEALLREALRAPDGSRVIDDPRPFVSSD